MNVLLSLPPQDDGLVALCEGCPGLHYVCISNCSHLTDQSILSLATNCPRLVTLECAGLSLLTDTGFVVRHDINQKFTKNCNISL